MESNNFKVELVKGALKNVLEQHDSSKIAEYFTEDAVIQINEKILQGHQEIASRLDWIRENTTAVTIEIYNIFFSGNEGFDHHTSEFLDQNGDQQLLKIFGYIKLKGNKISRYEDVTIALNRGDDLSNATSTRRE